MAEDIYDENRLGLIRAYWLGQNLTYLGNKCELVLGNKEEFKVRGREGDSLIHGLATINRTLDKLNITPSVQRHIMDVIEYLNGKYVDPLYPSAYLSLDDAKTLYENSKSWKYDIEKSLRNDFYEPYKIGSEPIIFIGHGHDNSWKDLKEHLVEKQCLSVEEFNIEPRAGYSTKEILEKMKERSSMALLVLTGESLDINRKIHAPENVIHEVGLFQGELGFNKTIPILENGIVEFSNIQGTQQIRFDKGKIREIFGDVVAVIRREFPHLIYNPERRY